MEPEQAVALIRKFGADKVFWGTDYPAWGHEDEIELFEKLELTEAEREMILFKNAAEFLHIEGY